MSTLSNSDSPAFIIWTLQRTGGTNLAKQLMERSPHFAGQHEPFNIERTYGHVTQYWIEMRDKTALDAAITEICAQGILIKHCVEVVPWEITEALIHAAVATGYAHLFLYRNNSADRLLSLHFAQQTGVWGPNRGDFNTLVGAREANSYLAVDKASKESLRTPLPVEKLIQHEKNSQIALTRTWNLLTNLGVQPLSLAYEDIYGTADPEQPVHRLLAVLSQLRLAKTDAEDRAWIAGVISQGNQGTKDQYDRIPGAGELRKRSAILPKFEPARQAKPVVVRSPDLFHPWIMHHLIDVAPHWIRDGEEFVLGGVVVLSSLAPKDLRLELVNSHHTWPVQWGIPSNRMANQYPQSPNSGKARFEVESVRFDPDEDGLFLLLYDSEGQALVLSELFIKTIDLSEPARINPASGQQIIFDVGANDGSDTYYYLRKGFRVVAVEAVPELANHLKNHLNQYIEINQLIVEEVAIAAQTGEMEFTVNEEWTEWSSLNMATKATAGQHRRIMVRTNTLAALITRYGVPYYLKIDIEGGELTALSSLDGSMCPSYVSIELNPDWENNLDVLYVLGYRKFQLVRQDAPYLPSANWPSHEGLEYRCPFTVSMSGPFGRDLPEWRWKTLARVIAEIIETQQEMQQRKSCGEKPGWYDVHAAWKDAQ